jgi:predicted O-methyltransferase YrrM
MYPKTFSGLPAVQVESELRALISLIKEKGVKSYLEVGVGRGDTFHEIVSALPKGSLAVVVDLPASKWGFKDSKPYLEKAIEDLIRKGYDVRVFLGKSGDIGIINQVASLAPFDLVFIDADHTYKGVKADFKNYSTMGNIVALHDIAEISHECEVHRFWDDIKTKNDLELVERPGSYGIGVIFAGDMGE